MTIRCRYCETDILLNADSMEARTAGTDPHQQMRKHLAGHGFAVAVNHGQKCGWLLDALAFDCTDEPEKYRTVIDALVTYLQKAPLL